MDIRQLINEMAHEIECVNKSFTAKDLNFNNEHYARFKDVISKLMSTGATIHVAETWESGLVCVEVTLDKVVF